MRGKAGKSLKNEWDGGVEILGLACKVQRASLSLVVTISPISLPLKVNTSWQSGCLPANLIGYSGRDANPWKAGRPRKKSEETGLAKVAAPFWADFFPVCVRGWVRLSCEVSTWRCDLGDLWGFRGAAMHLQDDISFFSPSIHELNHEGSSRKYKSWAPLETSTKPGLKIDFQMEQWNILVMLKLNINCSLCYDLSLLKLVSLGFSLSLPD